MFSLKRKLSPALKDSLKNNFYNRYRVLIEYKSIKNEIEKKIKFSNGEILFSIEEIQCIAANINTTTLLRLIELPEVKYILLDEYAFLCGRTPLLSNGVSLQSNNSILKGDYSLSGRNIGIGLVDSGCYPHKDIIYPNNKIKCFIDLINDYKYPYDDNGHGTFISGVLCGSGHESKNKNRGIAINSHLLVVKAFDSAGKGYISSTLMAIQKIIEFSEEYNIKVICLPFEIYSTSNDILSLYSKLFKIALERNIIIIVPSGNNGTEEDSIRGIATLKEVITIGGMDTHFGNNIYPFSSCGSSKSISKPDFIAASVDIISLNADTNYISERNGLKIYPKKLSKPYVEYNGTSIACAYISGVCALLYEYNSELNFKDIYGLLKNSSSFIKEKKCMQGNGYIDLNKILPKKDGK